MTSREPDRTSVTQLTPLLLLERSASVYKDKPAISYGSRVLTYGQFGEMVTRVARALRASGVKPGDRVAYLMPNLPEMLIAHFAVPLCRAVLVAINTRLSGPEIEYILNHSGASLLVADTALLPVVAPRLSAVSGLREVIALDDIGRSAELEAVDYSEFLERGNDQPLPFRVDDEHRPISINYTSGTTGRPKGVQYTHRGAYLNALAEVIHSHHDPDSV
ncbi:MAG: AMP-binding protein, partial [Acidimicrobiia bacterium]